MEGCFVIYFLVLPHTSILFFFISLSRSFRIFPVRSLTPPPLDPFSSLSSFWNHFQPSYFLSSGFLFVLVMAADVPIPAGRPRSYPVIPPVAFLISGRGYFLFFTDSQNTTERVEEKNKQKRVWVSSKCKKERSLWLFLRILWANASVYSCENSHKRH